MATKVKLFGAIQDSEKLELNKPYLVRIGEREICLIRRADQMVAFKNQCPHLRHPLHLGHTNPFGEIVCPLHTYKFNLTTGEEADQKCSSLEFYEIEIEKSGEVMILV